MAILILDNIGTGDDRGGLLVGSLGERRSRKERRGQTKTNHDDELWLSHLWQREKIKEWERRPPSESEAAAK